MSDHQERLNASREALWELLRMAREEVRLLLEAPIENRTPMHQVYMFLDRLIARASRVWKL